MRGFLLGGLAAAVAFGAAWPANGDDKKAPKKNADPAAKVPRVKYPSMAEREAAKEYFGFPETLRLTRDQSLAITALAKEYAPQIAGSAASLAEAQQTLAAARQAQAQRGRGQPTDPHVAELARKASKQAGEQTKAAAGAVKEAREKALALLTEKQLAEIGMAGWKPEKKKEAAGGKKPAPDADHEKKPAPDAAKKKKAK